MSNRGLPATDSSAVIKQGAQAVSSRGKNADEKSVVPASTLRALQLRNGKGGSFGMGEVMRIPGREKLELIAEDEMEKTKEERRRNTFEAGMNSSLKAPFRLETILKIAQSQMDAYIDFINALHKPDLCYDIMNDEIRAQCPPTNGARDPDLMQIPSFVAKQFGICVHNAHMLASGWVILYESFRKLQVVGLKDREIYMQVQTDAMIRDIYLSAYGLLKKLVNAGQQRLRSIVRNTPHYAPYFRSSNEATDCQEFERSEVRKMYSSFLDSAIVELCLPGSKFSPQALYFCLHMTSEESPTQLRRCPQLMWDAVGDLAECVRLMDIMETPLIAQGFDFKTEDSSSVFTEFVRWNDAQAISIRSATQYSSFVNLVYPLTNLKNKSALDKTWDRLHANYIRESGQNIDALWQLVDARHRIPHFSTLTVSSDLLYGASKNGDKALVRHNRNGKRKPVRTIANSRKGEESDSSMPGLLDMSGSEDEGQNTGSDEDDDIRSVLSSEYGSTVEDDEYDEREQVLKRQQREAIDLLFANPDSIDLNNDKYANERKKNPLLLLLSNLRGRLFTSSSALRTDGMTTVTSKSTKSQATKTPLVRPSFGIKASDSKLSTSLGHSARPTMSPIEDADDESDEHKGGGDKKKKKKPKKKKKKPTIEAAEAPKVEAPSSPASEPPRTPSPPPDPEVASLVSSKALAEGKKPAAPKSPSIKTPSVKSSLSGTTASTSTTALQLPQEQKAPSAHSYLQQINAIKTKTKTRPDQPVEVPPAKERKNLFDKLRGKDVPKETKDKNSADVFRRLKRKTGTFARRLFGVTAQDKKGALKWDQFLQVMRELGFDYDPSTAGSSVRFDPPNPNDRSISFHKPHPDPTLHQNVLKQYRDKLEEYYGWSPEKFQNAMQDIEGMNNEDSDQ